MANFEEDMPDIEAPKDKVSSDDLTFKEAFKLARKSGDKTFTWRGKKFTTELASEKKPAKKEDDEELPSYGTSGSGSRGGRRNYSEEGIAAVAAKDMRNTKGGYGMPGRIPSGDKVISNLASREAGRRDSERKARNRMLNKPDEQGLKRGGTVGSASKRADGIAQRGKTRGKMY